MSCNCNKAFAVPVGAYNLNLGVYKPGVTLYVLFETATVRRDVVEITCDTSGIIQFPMPDLRIDTPYEVSITEKGDPEQTTKQWQVGADIVSCVSLQFVQPQHGDQLLTEGVYAISLKPW